MGVGVGLCVLTDLGADALGVLWEGIAKHLPITVGQSALLVTCACLLMVVLIDKKELGLATIQNPIATSMMTDLVIKQVTFQGILSLKLCILVIVFFLSVLGPALPLRPIPAKKVTLL